MGSKLKELVKEKELSNLYIDLSEEILKNLVFDSSPQDNQNQLLFLNCIENSISYLADDIYKSFQLEDSKDKLVSDHDKNLIISNQSNDLKKFSLILDKYKIFKELLRKILDEC